MQEFVMLVSDAHEPFPRKPGDPWIPPQNVVTALFKDPKIGAKLTKVAAMLGPYDLVIHFETEDNQQASAAGIAVGALFQAKTSTMPALPCDAAGAEMIARGFNAASELQAGGPGAVVTAIADSAERVGDFVVGDHGQISGHDGQISGHS